MRVGWERTSHTGDKVVEAMKPTVDPQDKISR